PTGNDGKVQTTLTASTLATELTLQASAGSVSATKQIRYSVSIPGLTITANPPQIPDDNTTTSQITIKSSSDAQPLPQNLRFTLSADQGALLSAGAEGTDQRTLIVTVGNNEPAGEGNEEARALLKGPVPDLSQTQNRTITLTASLVVDGMPRTFTQTVTLLPRIQISSNFGLSNNPNQLVVSSSNDTEYTRRQPLDYVQGHNKAVIRVRVNGAGTPNPSFVTLNSTDPNVLFRALELDQGTGNPTTNELGRQLGNISVNLTRITENTPENTDDHWDIYVEVYSSTLALPQVTINIGVLSVNRTIVYKQIAGLPAQVTVAPDNSVIGVQGMTSVPTSTTIRAYVRDAANNLVTVPGVVVTFSSEAGTLNPTSVNAVEGVATTTLTSNNETRRVRVFATAQKDNATATGATTVVFAVAVSNITLTTDKPRDEQGRVLLDPNDNVRVIANFSPTGSIPNGTIPQVQLTGAYGLIQSLLPAQNERSDVIINNNNTTNIDQIATVQFTVYNLQGLPVSSPEQVIVMKGVTAQPIVQLS
ncbi:MAG: Ig-like domain-containing protein, partial [Armatimonadota bacterium]